MENVVYDKVEHAKHPNYPAIKLTIVIFHTLLFCTVTWEKYSNIVQIMVFTLLRLFEVPYLYTVVVRFFFILHKT